MTIVVHSSAIAAGEYVQALGSWSNNIRVKRVIADKLALKPSMVGEEWNRN